MISINRYGYIVDFEQQKTIANVVELSGIGFHSGLTVSVKLIPAPCDHGIIFQRSDVACDNKIAARYDCVNDLNRSTGIVNGAGVCTRTVEHLMATLAALRIDNLLIVLNAPELPIFDGSARDWLVAIRSAGIKKQVLARHAIRILKPISVHSGGASASFMPTKAESTIEMNIDFSSKIIAKQSGTYHIDTDDFAKTIAPARTFGFISDIDQLHARGLALGASFDNVVAISGDNILNPEGLRFSDEFLRHKILDALGDLYLAGCPIIGHFIGNKSGHALHNRLLHVLFADRSTWTYAAVFEPEAKAAAADKKTIAA